ncbi:MAG: hypothetical protein E4H14_08780 [Candidatus Thorarchaeota archaeon]|nr:MAG: hypothetical protein E4H14_08780 [Candidatus Thorarchaeota archaeon]
MKNKTKIYFLFILFLSGLFMVPILGESVPLTSESIPMNESIQSGIMPRDIRVAIYDESNMTYPVYAANPGGKNNNVTFLQDVLEDAGYQATLLDVQDISDYKLKTADYDVLVLADNFPRENITNQIMNFWLGGGGILSFDGSSGFLCSFGVLPPEAIGTSGYPAYWDYISDNIVIEERHPVAKSYSVGQVVDTTSGYLAWDYPALQATVIGSDLTMVASSGSNPNRASVLAFDPTDRGGKIVTIAFDLDTESIPELNSLYIDAVDWLTPRPKGRILFDLTHMPYYGVDGGEPTGYSSNPRFATLRDELVSKTFTFDKLYPDDSAVLTPAILEKYDMLIINIPEDAYSAAEISAIQSWISDGGGLFVMGDSPGFANENANIREIIAGYDMNITETTFNPTLFAANNITLHPVNEALDFIEFEGGSYVESWGSAVTLVRGIDGNKTVVAQEIGSGRVILAGDINFLATSIANQDNLRFGYNIANWLCSGGANILLYTDGKTSLGINYNFFKSPAALALNELGVNYYMTNERDYFNESLKLQSWDLLIIDCNNYAPSTAHSLIRDHIESGGRVIWRDFMFRYSANDDMWNFLGWKGLDNTIQAGPPTVFQWDAGHPVFNMPVDYGADNFTSSHNLFSTDYANVTVLENGTAIAGTSPTPNENASAIIMSHGGRVLCNMFAISEYLDDTDDSTYADGFELFMNEIAYMLQPSVNHPSNIEYTEGETGNSIVWLGYSEMPYEYIIEMDSSPVHTAVWNGGTVSYNVDGLTNGTYVFSITLYDDAGYSVSDSVTVTVLPASATNTTTTTTGVGTALDPTLIIIILVVIGAVLIIIIIIMKKRPSS